MAHRKFGLLSAGASVVLPDPLPSILCSRSYDRVKLSGICLRFRKSSMQYTDTISRSALHWTLNNDYFVAGNQPSTCYLQATECLWMPFIVCMISISQSQSITTLPFVVLLLSAGGGTRTHILLKTRTTFSSVHSGGFPISLHQPIPLNEEPLPIAGRSLLWVGVGAPDRVCAATRYSITLYPNIVSQNL